jgi:predicted MFS family arabinose efflux permease
MSESGGRLPRPEPEQRPGAETTGSGAGWLVVAAYGAVAAANQLLWLTFAPVTTSAARHLGVSVSAVGWLSEVFPLLYVVLALPAGALLDRWFRPGLVAGAALSAVGSLLRLDERFWAVLVGQVAVAVAQPFVLNALTKLAGEQLQPKDRPAGIAIGSAALFAGMLAALVLGATLGASHLGLVLDIDAAFATAGALALGIALTRPRVSEATATSGVERLRQVWGRRELRLLVWLVFVGFGVFISLTTWLQALLAHYHQSSSVAGVMLVGMLLAGIVGSATLPSLVLGRHRQRRLFAIAVAMSALGAVTLAFDHDEIVEGVAVVLVGLVLLGALPVILELAERGAGPNGATATALIWLAGNAGGIVVALVVQALLGHPPLAFALLALVALGALPAVGWLEAPSRSATRPGRLAGPEHR